VLQLRFFETSQLTPPVFEFPPCGRSLLAQHHDVVIIDNLATGSAGDVQRHPGKPGTMVEQLRENNLFMPIFLRETLRVLT
jgi:UDP-glucose 4-epimerase